MQAIILAAGMGKRLGDLTKDRTKCMVEVLGVSLIERLINQLYSCCITNIVIVVGYKGEELVSFVNNKFKHKTALKFNFIENKIFDKTNNIYSLFLAKKYLEEDDTILIESDLIFDEELLMSLLSHPDENVVAIGKLENWMEGTIVNINEDNKIVNFVNKNKFNDCHLYEYYKTINLYKFSKNFSRNHYVPFLEAYCKSMGNNEYYEEVLRVIAYLEKCKLTGLVAAKAQKWYEIDDIQDLDIAEAVFASGVEKVNKYNSRYGGYWRFPNMLDYCYLVNPYFPPKVLIDEIQHSFSELVQQYPSGQKVNRLIASKIFGVNSSNILVGNGAAEIINAFLSNLQHSIGVICPTFEEYPNRVVESLIKKFYTSNNDYSYTADDLIKFSKDLKYFILINPDNPSGNYIQKNEVIRVLDYFKKKEKILILDESFVDFTNDTINNTLINQEVLDKYPNLVIIKSISKSYGVPGLRLGVVASSNKKIMEQINSYLSIWNINSFAEFFMQIFDKYKKDYILGCNKIVDTRKDFFYKLKEISFLRVIPSQSNYFLCEVFTPLSSSKLTIILLCNYNILIKDCSNKLGFEGKQYVRLAIRNKDENENLVSALLNICDLFKDGLLIFSEE